MGLSRGNLAVELVANKWWVTSADGKTKLLRAKDEEQVQNPGKS